MKHFHRLFASFIFFVLLFGASVITNKALAYSGTVYSPNNQTLIGNPTSFNIEATMTYAQQDITTAVAAPTNSNNTCGPITGWTPIVMLYYNGSYQTFEGTQFPITQTTGTSFVDISNFRNVTWQGIKMGIRFNDNNNCIWSDPATILSSSSTGLIISDSNVLLSLTDLPVAFNYPLQPNAPASINRIPNISIDTGRIYQYLGSFTEPSLNSLNATVDYGDGSGVQSLTLNGTSFNLKHIYSSAGTYTVTVSITNSQSNTISQTASVTVKDSDWTWTQSNNTFSNNSDTSYTFTYNLNTNAQNSNFLRLRWCGSASNPSNANSLVLDNYDGPQTNDPNIGIAELEVDDTSHNTVYYNGSYPVPTGTVNISVDCVSGTVKINNDTIVTGLTSSVGTYNTIFFGTDNYLYGVNDPSYIGFTTVCAPFLLNCPASTPPVPPSLGTITVSTNPVQVNNATAATVIFNDPAGGSSDTAIWDWGDGNTTNGTVIENNGSGSVTDGHTYTTAGVYTVKLTVTNPSDNLSTTQIFQYVSVYNPTAHGLFSAGQHLNSPAGAYVANTNLTGTVKFGLSYKYQGTVPVGDKQFTMNFQAANLLFNATSVTSLVTANGIGTLAGTGTINGSGTYNFLVTGDGTANTIRIQITDSSGNVIYDTQQGTATTAEPTTSVTGNVIVH